MSGISRKEIEHFNDVMDEFDGLTNAQAYVNVFAKRIMKPVPNKCGEYFGCDQRIDMGPVLRGLVEKLPEHAEIFDVGAGAGDVVDFALKYAPKNTVINIEEPNKGLIDSYLKRLQKYPNLKQGIAYNGFLQDYYQNNLSEQTPKKAQNLILAIHMIYHLTNFTAPKIKPEVDIIEAFSFLYGLLAPGGNIFIVYADLLENAQGEAVCGLSEKYFRKNDTQGKIADNLLSIYKARNQLLGPEGTICEHLKNRFPETNPKMISQRHHTHFFGETVADIGVMGLAGELCPSNDEKFDIDKLKFCLNYVSEKPERFHLQKEQGEVPQKGLWRANEPQVIAVITKE